MLPLKALMFPCHWIITLNSIALVFAESDDGNIYCDQVLNEENLAVMNGTSIKATRYNEATIFYDVFPRRDFATDFCDMNSEHRVRLSLDRITRISDILIEALPFVTNPSAIKVSISRGATSFPCFYSMKKKEYSNRNFFAYECVANATADYYRAGFYINTIEIKSVIPLTLNVTNLKRKQELGWLVLIQNTSESGIDYPERCPPPGLYPDQTMEPAKAFYPQGANVTIQCEDARFTPSGGAQRTCGLDGKWSPKSEEKSVCKPKRQWYESNPSSINRNVSEGMRNVSHVFHFERVFFSILKLYIGFSVKLKQGEAKRTLSLNVVYHVMNLSRVIYEHRMGSIDWDDEVDKGLGITTFYAIDYCANCSVRVTFLEYHWNTWIVKDTFYVFALSSPFENAEKYLGFSPYDECPPIDPYHGMPESFTDYQLILNNSINKLLRQSPCRPGYTFLGDELLLNQCRYRRWIGNGFPVCELIKPSTPPAVDDATWDYVHSDVFHEIKYTCANGLYLSGSGQAFYSSESKNWIDVPDGCRGAAFLFLETNWPYICIGILAVIIAVLAVFILRRYRSGTRTATTFRGHAIGETTERFETRVWTRPNYDPGRQECDVPAIPRPEPREQFHDYAVIYGDLSSVHSYQDVSSVHTYHDVSHAHYRN